MNRRDFVKGAVALGAVAAMGVATGCSTETTSEPEAPTGDYTGQGLHDGVFVTQVVGHEDRIIVETDIRDKKIVKCVVLNNWETGGVGTVACQRVPAAIVESQTTNVDTVAGATISSNAIKSAVRQAILDAGGSDSDFSTELPAASVTPSAQDVTTDVVVMGLGTAGMIAATRLLELGRSVIVFEKGDLAGGSALFTFGGIKGVESQVYKNWSLGRFDDGNAINLEARMEAEAEGYIPENDKYAGKRPFGRAALLANGKLIDFLANSGAGYCGLGSMYFASGAMGLITAPGVYGGGFGYLAKFLVDRIAARGGAVYYRTPVTALTKDADGKITGVTAVGQDGVTWNVTAKAVLLASGGYAKNKDLLQQYDPDFADQYFGCGWWSTGDGTQLGLDAGSSIECNGRMLPAYPATANPVHYEVAFLGLSAGILVNGATGKVETDTNGHEYMSQLKMDPNYNYLYWFMDDAGAEGIKNSEMLHMRAYEAVFHNGSAVHYDSVAEAAQATGISNLQAIIDEQAELSLDPESGATWIDARKGIWCMKIDPVHYISTGGLMIDPSAHVLTAEGAVIPGLYAAGDVAGSLSEKEGIHYLSGAAMALGYGWVSADSVHADLA